jgi:hypothetical protein
MQYIFVAYIYNLNTILVRAIPSKNKAAMITAFTKILATLTAHGYKPTINLMDNECSKMVETYIKYNKMDIPLVPPHNHQVNAAKCAITTFKERFIAGLAAVDRNCPLQLWDEFLLQVKLTLNILHFSHRDPSKLTMRKSMARMTSTKFQLCQLVQKELSTTTLLSAPAGHRTELMHSTLALPPSTSNVCNSTCQPPSNVALQTHGIYTQAIVRYQLFQLLISGSLQHATCSGH